MSIAVNNHGRRPRREIDPIVWSDNIRRVKRMLKKRKKAGDEDRTRNLNLGKVTLYH